MNGFTEDQILDLRAGEAPFNTNLTFIKKQPAYGGLFFYVMLAHAIK